MRCSFCELKLAFLRRTVAAPVPRLLDELELGSDGTLDVRTWMLSGRFRSAKLEAAFNNYLFAIWLPRFRMIASVGVLIELWALIDSLLCGCGVRVGVYTGGTLIYSYVFPSSILLVVILTLSPKPMRKIGTDKAPLIIAIGTVVLAAGYTLPLAAFLRDQPVYTAADNSTASTQLIECLHNATLASRSTDGQTGDGVRLRDDLVAACVTATSAVLQRPVAAVTQNALWCLSTITILLSFLSLGATSLGVGPLPLALFLPIPMALFINFNYVWFSRYYNTTLDLVTPSMVIYLLTVLITYVHNKSTRREFLVRIYAQHEKDVRVEQLQREKERLDYERRFALHHASRSPELRGLAADGPVPSELELALVADGPEQDRAAHEDAQMGATSSSLPTRDPREVDGSLTALAAHGPSSRADTDWANESSAAASVLSEPELLTAALEEAKEGASTPDRSQRSATVNSKGVKASALGREHMNSLISTTNTGHTSAGTTLASLDETRAAVLMHPAPIVADASSHNEGLQRPMAEGGTAGWTAMMSVRAAAKLPVIRSAGRSDTSESAVSDDRDCRSDTSTSTTPATRRTNRNRDAALWRTLSAMGIEFSAPSSSRDARV